MLRGARVAALSLLVVMLILNAAVYVPLIQRDGLGVVFDNFGTMVTSSIPSSSSESDGAQFACSEVERGEAAVWPWVSLWLSGQILELPDREDVGIAIGVLENTQELRISPAFKTWVEKRRALLAPFLDDGMHQSAEEVGKNFQILRELNDEFADFCETVSNTASYKGFSVSDSGIYPGLIAWSDGDDFGGVGTPLCFVVLSDEVAEGVEELVMGAALVGDDAQHMGISDEFIVDLARPLQTQNREGEVARFGVFESADGTEIVASMDVIPEALPSQGPATLRCEAAYAPVGHGPSEETFVHLWR